MEKKYQVFVSSTYEDLKSERQSAISGLLDMNCIPVGMEQFPASPLSQWQYIKKMIDMSDYYLLIVGGRYGSIDPEEKISYTEKEYRYAVKNSIPIVAFLVNSVDSLPVSKAWKTDEERENIMRFRQDVMNAGIMVDFYENEQDLKYKIATAVPRMIQDVPRMGWVRADQVEKAIKVAGDESGFTELKAQLKNLQDVLIDKVEQTRIQWEEIPQNDIEALFEEKRENIVKVPTLSDNAKKLLVEAVNDSNGQILIIQSLEGTEIQTNNIVMNVSKVGREVIEWKDTISELEKLSLVECVGIKGQIYQLTKSAYDVVDIMLKEV